MKGLLSSLVSNRGRLIVTVVAAVMLVAALWQQLGGSRPAALPDSLPQQQRASAQQLHETVAELVASEDVLTLLRPVLRDLTRAVLDLELVDEVSRRAFAPTVRVEDLAAAAAESRRPGEDLAYRLRSWPLAAARTEPRESLELWQPAISGVEYFVSAGFRAVGGAFRSAERAGYDATVAFSGVAWMHSGEFGQVDAEVAVGLSRTESGESEYPWRIDAWRTRSFEIVRVAQPWFADRTSELVADPDLRARLRGHAQERYRVEAIRDPEGYRPPHPAFSIPAWDRQPGLAVVDIDQDGWDDLYLMEPWGKNMLLRNLEGRGLVDVAADHGLDLEDHCSSAVFADFDNDGDVDAVVGRTLAPSAYLVNHRGRFREQTGWVSGGASPGFVSSVSTVDVDRDGLLDLYFTTYADALIRQATGSFVPPYAERLTLTDYFAPEVAGRIEALTAADDYHGFLNTYGPPNMLLRNLGGGRFEVVADSPLAVWRNTYHAAWSDYDGDGDQDVYLANDFSPNNLFRNEGDLGFTDVTAATGTGDHGFGMGASWGDYDGDGALDLYTSNMYSKAGRRITAQLVPFGLDPRFPKAARGNTLFHNLGGGFQVVSEEGRGAAVVEHAGWSWGGKFADLNADGLLDIYVPNGYFTAPPQVALLDDT